jgi:hypothetical protein
MPRDVLRLTYEQPLLMRLYRDPVLVEGKWGHQWQYVVNDDEAICFLDEGAHEAIQASGAKSGDQILLTKAKVGGKAAYHAQIVEDDATMPDWVRHPEPAQATAAAPVRTNTSAVVTLPAKERKNGRTASASNGNGHHTPAAAPPASQPATPNAPGANVYAMALRAAIDAAKFAEEYAQSKHFDLKFTSEDVRCMAATLYIDQRKEGR